MIKRCLLYEATLRGSKARSSGRRCHEEGETETESGTGTGTGVGREPRIVEQNPIREMEWETEREMERNPKRETEREMERNPKQETEWETERNPKRETERETQRNPNRKTERETKRNPKLKTRKRGNEERPEAEGNTAREGDMSPNLTNERYSRI